MFVNLGYNLLCKNGNLAYIIPMAVTSSDAMTSLHNILEKNCKIIKVSSYSNRPKQIFDAACVRTSVFFFIKSLTTNEHILTTKLQRRRYKDSIADIIDNLEYIDSKELKLPGRFAKISNQMEKNILIKLFSTGKCIESYLDNNGQPFFYRAAGGRYFNIMTNYTTNSSAEKFINVKQKYRDLICSILSTSLFWFYQQVYTDGLNLKGTELENFPLPDFENKSEKQLLEIKEKYEEYLEDIERNANVHNSSGSSSYNIKTFKEYKLRKSKNLIDQLDDLICPLYGLTSEETEFIKNYEIEFRVEDDEE